MGLLPIEFFLFGVCGVQDGMTWFLNPPEQNLPMILADNGFDVWIANTRGTRFSRRHTNLDPDKPVFTPTLLPVYLTVKSFPSYNNY